MEKPCSEWAMPAMDATCLSLHPLREKFPATPDRRAPSPPRFLWGRRWRSRMRGLCWQEWALDGETVLRMGDARDGCDLSFSAPAQGEVPCDPRPSSAFSPTLLV